MMEGFRGQGGGEGGGGPSAGRGSFSDEEIESIRYYFEGHLTNKKVATIAECRTFLADHGTGKTAKQICDKVRNMIGRK